MASTAELLNDIWYGKSPMRYALWPVSTVYRGLARLRRTAYQRGWRPTVEAAVPVIVVGNVQNAYAREKGTRVYLLKGAKIDVNARLREEIEEKRRGH